MTIIQIPKGKKVIEQVESSSHTMDYYWTKWGEILFPTGAAGGGILMVSQEKRSIAGISVKIEARAVSRVSFPWWSWVQFSIRLATVQ